MSSSSQGEGVEGTGQGERRRASERTALQQHDPVSDGFISLGMTDVSEFPFRVEVTVCAYRVFATSMPLNLCSLFSAFYPAYRPARVH